MQDRQLYLLSRRNAYSTVSYYALSGKSVEYCKITRHKLNVLKAFIRHAQRRNLKKIAVRQFIYSKIGNLKRKLATSLQINLRADIYQYWLDVYYNQICPKGNILEYWKCYSSASTLGFCDIIVYELSIL